MTHGHAATQAGARVPGAAELGPRGPRLRPLDGVRGLAILAVLAFHTGGTWAGGGSVGVDVFFVLSGFLITTLLVRELRETGRIRLRSFYARRALRLFPALVLLLVGVLVYAAVDPSPVGTVKLGPGVLGTLFYVRDLQAAAGQLPVLGLLDHTWSLAIEEQFYLVWPLVLIIAARTGGIRRLTQVTVAATVVSAALPFLLWRGQQSVARLYYAPDTRAQQLLIGCLLGLALTSTSERRGIQLVRGARAAAPVALAGLVAVVLLSSWRDAATYLGGFTVFAIAAAVVVAAAANGTGLVARLVSLPPLVALGRISYGLYLWHWPVYLVLNSAFLGLSFWPTQLVRVAVALFVAAVSYGVVERPFLRLRHRVRPAAHPPRGTQTSVASSP